MSAKEVKEGRPLRERIDALPEDSVLFRSDFPEYHSEYVGGTFAELVNEGVLVKLSQGIYAKPRKSRFGIVLPSVDKVIKKIEERDKTQIIPSGTTALNALGLSTQVPMSYCFLTISSERVINLANRKVILKRGVPKNFCYKTRLAALLVQALRALKQNNVGPEELQTISKLISKESDQETFAKDVDMMPAWMKRIIKPMLISNIENGETLVK